MDEKPIEKLNEEKPPTPPTGPPCWEYVCQECGNTFTLPSPKGPADERERSCSKCGSKNIKWTGNIKSEACPPGG